MSLIKPEEVSSYMADWFSWCDQSGLRELRLLNHVTVNWRVADLGAFAAEVARLVPLSDHVHVTRKGGRLLGTFALTEPVVDAPVVRLEQGGSDGLNSVDFFIESVNYAKLILDQAGINYARHAQQQGLSLNFGNGREANILEYTALDVSAHEMSEASEELAGEL